MIPFRRPELSDRKALNDLFLASAYRGCEYSFVNIYIWGHQQFALVEGELVLFSHWDGRSMYVYPGSRSRKTIIEALEADAGERGIPMRLYGLDRAAVEEIEGLFPGKYGFSANRDGFDSMYRDAPAFSKTASRMGPGAPPRMDRVIFAFSSGVPPRSSAFVQRVKPKSSGLTV